MITKIKKAAIWYLDLRYRHHKRLYRFHREYDNFITDNWKELIEL
jgi:hypothetical protein